MAARRGEKGDRPLCIAAVTASQLLALGGIKADGELRTPPAADDRQRRSLGHDRVQ